MDPTHSRCSLNKFFYLERFVAFTVRGRSTVTDCGDESLYHDAYAYWHEEDDDLLCPQCFKKQRQPHGYVRVVTYH